MAPQHLQLSDDGEHLWDGDKWISVHGVPLRLLGHIPDVRLSHDDNFWWNPVKQRWEAVSDAPASAHPPAGPPEAHNAVTSDAGDRDEPPSAEHMQWGRDFVEGTCQTVIQPATEIAEKLAGAPESVILEILEKGGEGAHALETLGVEGGLIFGGATAAAIIVPFAMWYEAIRANSEGNMHRIRWAIYEPWMHGFISGLYNTNTGGGDAPFTSWHDHGNAFTSGLDDDGKRAVTGALIAIYVFNTSSTQAVHARLTHDQWSQRHSWQHAWSGLEIVLSALG